MRSVVTVNNADAYRAAWISKYGVRHPDEDETPEHIVDAMNAHPLAVYRRESGQ